LPGPRGQPRAGAAGRRVRAPRPVLPVDPRRLVRQSLLPDHGGRRPRRRRSRVPRGGRTRRVDHEGRRGEPRRLRRQQPRPAVPAAAGQVGHEAAAHAADHRRPARRQGRVVALVRGRLERRQGRRGGRAHAASQSLPVREADHGHAGGPRADPRRLRVSTALRDGTLPAVAFVKPHAPRNAHPAYSTVGAGDLWIGETVREIMASRYWPRIAVVVTYDEGGGWFDHVRPPVVDRFGLGTRVPALIVSPYARRGVIAHGQYEHASVLKFVEWRWDLAPLT